MDKVGNTPGLPVCHWAAFDLDEAERSRAEAFMAAQTRKHPSRLPERWAFVFIPGSFATMTHVLDLATNERCELTDLSLM